MPIGRLAGKKRWIAASTLAAIALSMALSAAMEEVRLANAREKTRARVEAYAARVSFHLHASLHPSLYVQGAARDGSLDEAEFGAIADAALASRRELVALAYAEGGVVRFVAPSATGPLIPGSDLFRDAASSAAALRSRFTGLSTISAPLEGWPDAPTILALVPIGVVREKEPSGFGGFAAAIISLPQLLADAGLSGLAAEGYDYRLLCRDGSDARVLAASVSGGGDPRDPVTVALLTEGREWALEASPAGGWIVAWTHLGYAFAALGLGSLAYGLALAAARYLESEQRYRLIAENARDVIWTASFPDLRITYMSPSIERLTGYGPDEAVGRSLADVYPAESAELVREALERRVPGAVMGDPRAVSGRTELLQRRRDGREVWIGLETTFISDHRGRIRAVLGIARDIDERKHAELELARLATTDPLTEVANRRLLFEAAARELARAARSGVPTALAMLDLDGFKALNDERGHQAGDLVLAAVAGALKSAVRAEDLVGRYGGEEFAMLLPGTDLERASALAERIRGLVATLRFEGGDGSYGVTASLGVAVAEPGDRDFDALVAAADAALYEAKRAGRNRVVLSPSPPR